MTRGREVPPAAAFRAGRAVRRAPLAAMVLLALASTLLAARAARPGAARGAASAPARPAAVADASLRPCGALTRVGQEGGPTHALAPEADGLVWIGVGPRLEAWRAAADAGGLQREGRSPVLPGIVEDVALRGGHAFVAAGRGGLVVLDLGNPHAPRVVAALPLEGLAAGVRLDGDHAYVQAGWGGLHVVDVSTPAAPRAVGRFQAIVSDAAVGGDWAYVVSRNLKLVDLRDRAAPRERAKMAEWADAVELVGGLLYAGVSDDPDRPDRTGRLAVFDVRDPDRDRPRLGAVDVGQPVRDLALDGAMAYVLTRAELVVVDVSDPARPRVVRRAPARPNARRIALGPAGGPIWLAVAGDGLTRAAREGLEDAVVVPTLGAAASLAALDGRWLVLEDEGERGGDTARLRTVDVSDPSAPRFVGALSLVVDQRALATAPGRAYVGTPEGELVVVDLADPAAPRLAGRVALAGRRIWALAPEGDLVWVANDDRLRAVDVSDPAAPREVGSVKPKWGATDVAVDGRHAYVTGPDSRRDTDFDRLHVVDVSDPRRPVVLGDTPVDGWHDGLWAAQGLVALGGLALYDARDPAAIAWLGGLELGGAVADKIVVGGVAVAALEDVDQGGGLVRTVDLADPRRPQALGAVDTLAPARDVAALSTDLAVAAGEAGLWIVRGGEPVPVPTEGAPPPPIDRVASVYLPLALRGAFGCRGG